MKAAPTSNASAERVVSVVDTIGSFGGFLGVLSFPVIDSTNIRHALILPLSFHVI